MARIFIDVDVQRDFCEPDGALYVPGSPNDAFRELTRMALERRIPILGSVDSHAFDAWEFASNGHVGPSGEDPRFPDHCVKGSDGWLKVDGTLPKRFRFVANVAGQSMGGLAHELARGDCQAVYFEKEVYSLFANPMAEPLLAALAEHFGRLECVVYGVATDYCVQAAALGLRERGFDTLLLRDATAGITPAGVEQALAKLAAAGVRLANLRDL
jgi:nicotinamidase/pyrazinamidase